MQPSNDTEYNKDEFFDAMIEDGGSSMGDLEDLVNLALQEKPKEFTEYLANVVTTDATVFNHRGNYLGSVRYHKNTPDPDSPAGKLRIFLRNMLSEMNE